MNLTRRFEKLGREAKQALREYNRISGAVDISSSPSVSFIGIAELVGVLGIIVPQMANIAPVLTPIAAIGLAVIVLFGATFHMMRKEYKQIGVNIVFFVLAVVVAVGRM
ncbi:DoxX family protein [Paenibacillus albidus]|uniref:DoxX family protein n=1 Tax=Paenibacillus albidus TaxID=2041023 RepID=UPI001BEC6668|nr:DoxX family protein [Paenibacillus albidus]MBT2288509.1 DoxX family protein [Paenibacillus albidus]